MGFARSGVAGGRRRDEGIEKGRVKLRGRVVVSRVIGDICCINK